jgi:dTDP-4-amino-4,6-dideoxygalactose transaminase
LPVPFVDIAGEIAPERAEIDSAIARVLDSGTFIGGPELVAFERELAQALRTRHVIGTSSGSDALHLLGMALGLGPVDEIVTTPFTFFATAGSFARLGARIVFADIDENTLCLDPRAAMSACTDRTRAIVIVNLFGRPADLPEVAPCPIIEDAAQSIGAGPLRGLAAAYSFFPTKNLGSIGDAGAIATDDPALIERVSLLRTHGARPKYHHVALGGNFRLDALQAAILRVRLRRLAEITAARRARARRYGELFATARVPAELRLPPHDENHVYHQFVIRTPRRDALREHLGARGIGTEVYYPTPLHKQPCFSDGPTLPKTERACREVLALPIYPSLTPSSQEEVVAAIAAFFQ